MTESEKNRTSPKKYGDSIKSAITKRRKHVISKEQHAIIEMQNADIKHSLQVNDEEMSLELGVAEYEITLSKNAYDDDGKLTKEFSQWLKFRNHFEYLRYMYPKFDNYVLERFVNRVALIVSKRFKNYEINSAISLGIEGNEVHGFLELHFSGFYEKLIDNEVLYRASYLSQKNNELSIMNYINKDITKMKLTKLYLYEEDNYELYPEIKFNEIFVKTDGPMIQALSWDKKHEEYIDEYPRVIEYTVANVSLLTFDPRGVPILVVTFAFGKTEGPAIKKIPTKDAETVVEDIKDKVILYLNTELEPLKSELEQSEMKRVKLKKNADELTYMVEELTQKPINFEEEFDSDNVQYKDSKMQMKSINWKNLIYMICVFAVIGILIAILLAIVNFTNNQASLNNTIETSSILTNILKTSLIR